MIYLGIDPGLDGAITLLDSETRAIRIFDMPTLNAGAGGKRIIDRGKVWDIVERCAACGVRLAVVETAVGVQKQSAARSCNFGRSGGHVEMAVIGNRIPILDIQASVWKTHFRIPPAKDKKARKALARKKASDLLPEHRHMWAASGEDGRAESALLALYAAELSRT